MVAVRMLLAVTVLSAISTLASGQSIDGADAAGRLSPVLNAPFSADAVITLMKTGANGVLTEQRGLSRYYRDAAGRTRIEHFAPETAGRLGSSPPQSITVDPTRPNGSSMTVIVATNTVYHGARGMAGMIFNGGDVFTIPAEPTGRWVKVYVPPRAESGVVEVLGERVIEGVRTEGRRVTTLIPPGRFGNVRAVEIVDQRWISPELGLTVEARVSDPLAGVIEYRLTNISRTELPKELFQLSGDFTPEAACTTAQLCYRSDSMSQANRQQGSGPIIE
jgi:hypothetical protein